MVQCKVFQPGKTNYVSDARVTSNNKMGCYTRNVYQLIKHRGRVVEKKENVKSEHIVFEPHNKLLRKTHKSTYSGTNYITLSVGTQKRKFTRLYHHNKRCSTALSIENITKYGIFNE